MEFKLTVIKSLDVLKRKISYINDFFALNLKKNITKNKQHTMKKLLIDKELVNILRWKNDVAENFKSMFLDEKIEFIESVIYRIKPLLDSSKHAYMENAFEGDEYGIGTYYNAFVNALEIYTNDTHTILRGWSIKQGNIYEYYENYGGSLIFCSFYTDAHPEKEFKTKWEFRDKENYWKDINKLSIEKPIKTSLGGFINQITC